MSEGEVAKLTDVLDEVQQRPSSIKKLRDHHHLVARLVAEGRRTTDIAFETGLSISRVSILKGDPAFQQLVEVYRCNHIQTYEAASYDNQRKWLLLENNALDHINDTYEETPEVIGTGEALSHAELASDRLGRKVSKSVTMTGTEYQSLAERIAIRKERAALLSAPASAEEPGPVETPALPVPAQDSKE